MCGTLHWQTRDVSPTESFCIERVSIGYTFTGN